MDGNTPTHNNKIGENILFDRTRRITGYLVGNLDRFNNAKRAEERDRVKHDGNLAQNGGTEHGK